MRKRKVRSLDTLRRRVRVVRPGCYELSVVVDMGGPPINIPPSRFFPKGLEMKNHADIRITLQRRKELDAQIQNYLRNGVEGHPVIAIASAGPLPPHWHECMIHMWMKDHDPPWQEWDWTPSKQKEIPIPHLLRKTLRREMPNLRRVPTPQRWAPLPL